MRIHAIGGFVAAVLLGALDAHAEPSAAQKALAGQVFDDAQKLAAANDFAGACPKYAESNRLDPQLGTLLYLGTCYEKIGKVASAWGSFKDAVDIAIQKHDERETKARAKVAELDPKVPRLVILAPAPPASLEIRADGEIVAKVLWGTKLPVDPGAHALTATADGKRAWKADVSLGIGESKTVTVPSLEDGAAPTAQSAPKPAVAAPSTGAPAEARHADRTLAYVAGGIGVVGVAAGSVTGLMAMGKKTTAEQNCTGSDCNATGKAAGDSAKGLATVSTIAFGVGVAGLAVGTVLWLAAGSSREAAAGERKWQVGAAPAASGGLLLSAGRTW
jgi:hypothetical protein